MRVLLDTNVVSELIRSAPDPAVVRWALDLTDADTYLSAINIGELKRGVYRLPKSRRRSRLEEDIDHFLSRFARRILPVDHSVVLVWAGVTVRHEQLGRRQETADELIAATAIMHDLTVATRNVDDFRHSGCRWLSPWTG